MGVGSRRKKEREQHQKRVNSFVAKKEEISGKLQSGWEKMGKQKKRQEGENDIKKEQQKEYDGKEKCLSRLKDND